MDADAAALADVDRKMSSVEGWFDDTEARAFIAVAHSQRRAGTTGDVLEIGAAAWAARADAAGPWRRVVPDRPRRRLAQLRSRPRRHR